MIALPRQAPNALLDLANGLVEVDAGAEPGDAARLLVELLIEARRRRAAREQQAGSEARKGGSSQ
jgi:hypothetical protein